MTNRTIQIWGQGYGPQPCTANVTFDGNTVFSGQISTIDSSTIYRLPEDQVVLISFEFPIDLSGTFPVTINIAGTDIFISSVLANFCSINNPVYTPTDVAILTNPATTFSDKLAIWSPLANPEFTSGDIVLLETGTPQEKQSVLADHGLSITVSTGPETFGLVAQPQCKTNVNINGVDSFPPDPLPPGVDGEWGWEIPCINGVGTCSFDLVIDPATT
jgi:hypothetical protein